MEWKEWINKRIFLRTKQGKVYSGIVIGINDLDQTHWFLELKDKFNMLVGIAIKEIIEIKEESGDGSKY